MADANRNGALRSVRLTFRVPKTSLDTLFAIARTHGWTNAANEPNLSAALNYLIDQYDLKQIKPKDREEARQDAQAYYEAQASTKEKRHG